MISTRTFRLGVLALAVSTLASCGAPKFALSSTAQGLQINVTKPVQQSLSIQSVQVEQNGSWSSPAFQVKYANRDEVVLGTKGESSLRVSVPGAMDATAAQVAFRTAPGKPLKTKLVKAK
ncbi:MAG: hypothetical protein FJX93_00295 [Bacteroidetes bacterium]|nr:hypothetical protein [Bacteroidota bacterium]